MHIVRAGGMEGFPELAKSMGLSPNELMEEVGLDPDVMRRPDVYVSYEKAAKLYRIATERSGDELFGLKLAALQGRRTLGLLGMFASLQPTVGEALAVLGRSLRYHGSGVEFSRVDVGSFSLFVVAFDLPESIGLEPLRLQSLGFAHRLIQRLAGEQWKALKVLLRQAEPKVGIQPLEKHFGCPVSCRASQDGILVDNSILAQPPVASKLKTQEFIDDHISAMEADYPDNIVQQVRHTINGLLPISDCRLENVAKVFDLNPRVLQQRLASRGTSFQRLLDEARLKIARQYLKHTNLPLTDIGLNLGYAELAVFSRAFKRWSGVTPSEWRRTARDHAPVVRSE